MDTFLCSSWYYLRYTDPKNDKAPFSKEAVNHWAPVDQYIGGIEHGSPSSSELEFLQAVSPSTAVISVGSNNTFGHPSGEVLGKLSRLNISTYRTDKLGAVKVVFDGSQHGFSLGFFDLAGKPITVEASSSLFCYSMMQKQQKRCKQEQEQALESVRESGKAALFNCYSGLNFFMCPVYFNKQMIAFAYGGGVAYSTEDISDALRKKYNIPVISEHKLMTIIDLLEQIMGMIPFGSVAKKAGEEVSKEYVWSIKEAFGTYPIWASIIAFMGCVCGEFLIWTQIVRYWTYDLKMPLDLATNLYVIIGVAGIFTMPILGIIADKAVVHYKNEVKGRKAMLIFAPSVGIVACILLLMMGKDSLILGGLVCVLFAIYWAIEPGGIVGYAGAIYGRVSLGKIWGLST